MLAAVIATLPGICTDPLWHWAAPGWVKPLLKTSIYSFSKRRHPPEWAAAVLSTGTAPVMLPQ